MLSYRSENDGYVGLVGCSKEGAVRILSLLIVAFLLATNVVLAQSPNNPDSGAQSEPRPSEESLRHLLDVMQAQKLVQTISAQMDGMFAGMLKKQLDGQEVTPEQQHAIEERQQAAKSMVKELLSWDSMEHLYLKVYGETFNQAEIDGMIGFYSSPVGQAVIAKLPQATKSSMAEIQARVQQMMPKLQQMAKEAAEQVKAQGAAKKSS
jgi:hypothetical protein